MTNLKTLVTIRFSYYSLGDKIFNNLELSDVPMVVEQANNAAEFFGHHVSSVDIEFLKVESEEE